MSVHASNNQTLPAFKNYLKKSFLAHLVLLIVFIFGSQAVLKMNKVRREQNISIVEASVRVDVVAMPTHTLQELKNISSGELEVKKEETLGNESLKKESDSLPSDKNLEEKSNTEDFLKEGKNNQKADNHEEKKKSFLGKLKEIGKKKVDGANEAKDTNKGLNGEKASSLKELALAGNKLSSGVAIYGSGQASDGSVFTQYISKLPDRVRVNWKLPSYLLDKKLKCRIQVWLKDDGSIAQLEVFQTSGDPEYDQRAIEAVKRSSPFPKLSPEISKRAMNGDIVLGFPL